MRYFKILILIVALSPLGGCWFFCQDTPRAEEQRNAPSSIENFAVVVYREYVRPIFAE